jgi:O-methyltransferase involved in polyketide biosynthesis
MARPHPETISPTAHYTGYVWYAHGQSHDAFATRTGRIMYHALRSPNVIAQRVGLPSLEGMLLARHRLIDLRLQQAIDAGEIEQVVEVAAGLSPRGWRFANRWGDRITYVEADLPGMIAHKRRILAALDGESPHHRTVEIDALADTGPRSIEAICESLDATRGTAILTEGLINYFERDVVLAMWRRFATALRRFPRSLYLSDLMLRDDNRGPISTGFSWLLSAFVRGRVHLHFDTAEQAEDALEQAGLVGLLLDPREFALELPDLEAAGAGRVRIVEAVAAPYALAA